MMMKHIFALLLCTIFAAKAQQTIRFSNPNEVLNFATQHSIALKSGNAQMALAKYQTYYAKINRFNHNFPSISKIPPVCNHSNTCFLCVVNKTIVCFYPCHPQTTYPKLCG